MANETNVTISPVLHYSDLAKGLQYLTGTFGFREHALHKGPDGDLVYAEIELGGCYVGVGRSAGGDSLFDLGPAAFYVALDDPDAHHERAVGAGAEVVMELVDQEYGSREYAVRDPEGNVWTFGTYRPGRS